LRRCCASRRRTCGALLALYWLDAGATGFFIAVAAGFAMYGALTAAALVHAGKSETQR